MSSSEQTHTLDQVIVNLFAVLYQNLKIKNDFSSPAVLSELLRSTQKTGNVPRLSNDEAIIAELTLKEILEKCFYNFKRTMLDILASGGFEVSCWEEINCKLLEQILFELACSINLLKFLPFVSVSTDDKILCYFYRSIQIKQWLTEYLERTIKIILLVPQTRYGRKLLAIFTDPGWSTKGVSLYWLNNDYEIIRDKSSEPFSNDLKRGDQNV